MRDFIVESYRSNEPMFEVLPAVEAHLKIKIS